MTTLQPPPERDLPPGRHTALRASIVREIGASRRRRPRALGIHRHLVPLVAAASVVLVIGVTVGVLRTTHRERPSGPGTPGVPGVPGVPGFTRDELDRLRNACVGRGVADRPGTGTGTPTDQVDLGRLRVHNAASDEHGTAVLLYSTTGWISCGWGAGEKIDDPAAGTGQISGDDPQRLLSIATIDFSQSGAAGGRYYRRIGGRVSADVARMYVRIGEDVVEPRIVNGTYLALTENGRAPTAADPQTPWLQAFDRNGEYLADYRPPLPEALPPGPCVTDKDGEVLLGNKPYAPTECLEAFPWGYPR